MFRLLRQQSPWREHHSQYVAMLLCDTSSHGYYVYDKTGYRYCLAEKKWPLVPLLSFAGEWPACLLRKQFKSQITIINELVAAEYLRLSEITMLPDGNLMRGNNVASIVTFTLSDINRCRKVEDQPIVNCTVNHLSIFTSAVVMGII